MADVPFACTTRAREIRVYVQTNRYINIFPISIERFLFAYATIIPIYLYFILLYVVQKKKNSTKNMYTKLDIQILVEYSLH